jgi:hypothetical protein
MRHRKLPHRTLLVATVGAAFVAYACGTNTDVPAVESDAGTDASFADGHSTEHDGASTTPSDGSSDSSLESDVDSGPDADVDSGSADSGSDAADSGPAVPVYCGHPKDCAVGTICSQDGTCKAGPCSGANACISGYSCAAGSGTCEAASADACDQDGDCAVGSLCIAGGSGGGVCTPSDQQCFDLSQCAAGQRCAAGKCTVACASSDDCRDGFACDTNRGLCTVAVQTCTLTNDCGSPSRVCVGGTCVPRSAFGSCARLDDVWTENGCIPVQAPELTCTKDGVQDVCAPGSICLHHSCFISCDPPNQNACASQLILDTCKPITSGGSTYNVCGTANGLGSQCGPGANGQTCSAAKVCVDGYCK